jgi:hypothetical protein
VEEFLALIGSYAEQELPTNIQKAKEDKNTLAFAARRTQPWTATVQEVPQEDLTAR